MRPAEWHLLNSTQSAIMPKIERGDLRAIAVLLKISERRCKLLGLDIQPLPAIRVAEYLENEKTTLEHEKLKLYSEALGRMKLFNI